MRLTLRTLLAYLDNLLAPEDADELGKRIEENKFATELVHRIRTRTRLLRLGAPKVDGRGIGLDPNTVAEYLDNTLAQERVPDLEKVCLESDVHLAEVASCHHILALVLDKPATVTPELRARAHELISLQSDDESVRTVEPPVMGPPVAEQPGLEPPVAATTAASPSPKRATKSTNWLGIVLTVAATFLLAAVAFQLIGPNQRSQTPVAQVDDKLSPAAKSSAGASTLAETGTEAATKPDDTAQRSEKPDSTAEAADDRKVAKAENLDKVESLAQPEKDAAGPDVADAAPAPTPAPAPARGAVEVGDARGAGAPPAAGKITRRISDSDPAKEAAEANAPTAKPGAADLAAVNNGRGRAKPLAPRTAPAGEPKPADNAPDKDDAPPGTVEVGRFFSEEHILARINPADELWYRLTRGTRLLAGDHVVSLPVYRPQISLTSGVQLMLVGEAALDLNIVGPDAMPSLTLAYGRMMVGGTGKPGSMVMLNLGGLEGLLRLTDADTDVAIEVRQYQSPGADPERDQALTIVELHARNGSAGWTVGDEEEISLAAGNAYIQIVGEPAKVEEVPFPAWSDPRSVAKLDRDASEQLESFLVPDRPLSLGLEERTEFRKTEVRSLVARCLVELGRYDAAIAELSSEQQHSYWGAASDALRAAMARSPETAKAIQASLDRLRHEDAKDLYRLLRDYSPEQLEKGGAQQLVDYLDHKAQDIRVLAYDNLRRITGSTLTYRPEASAERRRIPFSQWKKKLKDGAIVYKTPPAPLTSSRTPARP